MEDKALTWERKQNMQILWEAWVAQSVKHLPSAQVMIPESPHPALLSEGSAAPSVPPPAHILIHK